MREWNNLPAFLPLRSVCLFVLATDRSCILQPPSSTKVENEACKGCFGPTIRNQIGSSAEQVSYIDSSSFCMPSVLLLLKIHNSESSSFGSFGYREATKAQFPFFLAFLGDVSLDVCMCAVLCDTDHGEQLGHKRSLMPKASVTCFVVGWTCSLGRWDLVKTF